ncbi:MAG: Gfo/Idh/MocA family oxidoreductase [Candidatus Sumerlaeota bacterium]|nr:Gfo/Idh/MocA family oxidoreductase [Candidatus Sumerlaeota bacterium]
MTVKLGFIGTGGIANHHMKNISENKGFKVVAACDLMADRVKTFAEKWGIPHHYSDMDKMFAGERLDAIMVCTPNYAHKEPTIKALKAGIHVYCEKPMAMNVAEAEEMTAAAKKSKAILTIGHHMRFKPASQFVHKARLAGDLGEIYFGRVCYHRRGGVPWWGAFHIKDKSGGGALIDIGVHIIDLGLWLMGSPNPVQVFGATYAKLAKRTDGQRPNQDPKRAAEFDVDDFATAYVKMDNGATMAIECSWAANVGPKEKQAMEFYGDQGGATLDPLAVYTHRHGQYVDIAPQHLPNPQPHGEATEHFRRVILGEAENLVRPEQTLNVQKILDGIYQSSMTGEPIVCG